MGTIPDYLAPTTPIGDDLTLAGWQDGRQVAVPIGAVRAPGDDAALVQQAVTTATDALGVPAIRASVTLTRSPYQALTQRLSRDAFGLATYVKGLRTITDRPIRVVGGGNSHNNAQDASSIDLCPTMRFVLKLRAALPDRTIEFRNYAVSGSWTNQWIGPGNQLDQIAADGGADIVVVADPTNDGIANIFMGYEGFVGAGDTYGGYEAALETVFQRLNDMGCVVINVDAPYPHPTRAKANGRLTVTPEVYMNFPQPSMISYYLTLAWTKADNRLSAYAIGGQGQRFPFDLFNQYGGQLMGAGAFVLQFNPFTKTTGKCYKLASVASDGTFAVVDSTYQLQNGALTKLSDGIDQDFDDGVTQIWQNNFDNETQVVPPFSQCLVQRDVSGTGKPVSVSWRHWELNKLNHQVAIRNGVVTASWAAQQAKTLHSDADYDAQYSNGDDFHFPDAGYQLLDDPMGRIVADIVAGRDPSGKVY